MKRLLILLVSALVFVSCGEKKTQEPEITKISINEEESKLLGFTECDDIDTLYYFVSGETDIVIMQKADSLFNLYLDNKIDYLKIDNYVESIRHKVEKTF